MFTPTAKGVRNTIPCHTGIPESYSARVTLIHEARDTSHIGKGETRYTSNRSLFTPPKPTGRERERAGSVCKKRAADQTGGLALHYYTGIATH